MGKVCWGEERDCYNRELRICLRDFYEVREVFKKGSNLIRFLK